MEIERVKHTNIKFGFLFNEYSICHLFNAQILYERSAAKSRLTIGSHITSSE